MVIHQWLLPLGSRLVIEQAICPNYPSLAHNCLVVDHHDSPIVAEL